MKSPYDLRRKRVPASRPFAKANESYNSSPMVRHYALLYGIQMLPNLLKSSHSDMTFVYKQMPNLMSSWGIFQRLPGAHEGIVLVLTLFIDK